MTFAVAAPIAVAFAVAFAIAAALFMRTRIGFGLALVLELGFDPHIHLSHSVVSPHRRPDGILNVSHF